MNTWRNIFGLNFNLAIDTISAFTLHHWVLRFHHSASSCSQQGGISCAHHQKVESQPHLIT